ncbi:MAG: KAP family NTPase [Thermoflavifilum sp.]|nr:KAP family NTPase [Thermoflavifilum sp.]
MADQIKQLERHESYVIGIEGEWGSGKTYSDNKGFVVDKLSEKIKAP